MGIIQSAHTLTKYDRLYCPEEVGLILTTYIFKQTLFCQKVIFRFTEPDHNTANSTTFVKLLLMNYVRINFYTSRIHTSRLKKKCKVYMKISMRTDAI